MEEEIAFCRYGTALEPLEEDDVPAKKPIAIEDQIVTDSNGKRRFHGAFTGGFSAGFWNTVGSLEGWKPQSFKSSRNEKAERTNQKVFDFMDDEDLGEFGIAPQRVQTTDEFTPQSTEASSSSGARKHKLQQPSTGPIPGTPVLHQLLEPAKDNIAKRLLKKMGWKEGQGVGARLTKQEKKAARERNEREQYVMRMYGCEIGASPVPEKKPESTIEDSNSDISDSEITFAPDDFEAFVCGIKDNTFGLGYVGLNRNPVLSKQKHVNLFDAFEVVGTGNKKISIRGQAFGVGALEEEDDDIYEHVDMTKYDFSLEESRKRKSAAEADRVTDKSMLDGFHAPRNKLKSGKKVFTVPLPDVFVPRNFAVRRSRFEPIDDRRMAALQKQSEHLKMGLGKHDLDPEDRGRILGESRGEKHSTSSSARDTPSTSKEESKTVEEKSKRAGNSQRKMSYLEKINEKYRSKEVKNEKMLKLLDDDRFTSGGLISTKEDEVQLDESVRKDNEEVLSKAEKITEKLDKKSTVFKPFLGDPAKQERYEKFVEAKLRFDDDITKFLDTIQPLSMNEWDKEMEKKEFLQARNIYKPLRGLMSDRFVSEVAAVKEKEPEPTMIEKTVEITRTKCMWKPNSVLCKKFNVAEPYGGTMTADRMTKRSRFSVFDYIETSVNRKDNFVTPVIRPTKAEKPKPIIQQPVQRITEFVNETKNSDRLSTKDLFLQEKSGDTTKTRPKDSSAQKNESLETKSPLPSKSQADVKKPPKPQTELEKRILETKNKHPSEKKDLFKAIFESDDDDEDEKNESKPSESDSKIQVPLKSLNPAGASKSVTEINILESTALPKGIFSTSNPAKIDSNNPKPTSAHSNAKEIEKSINPKELNNQKSTESESDRLPTKIVFTSRDKREKKPETTDEHFYGPKIPTSFCPRQIVHSISPEKEVEEVDSKILEHLKKGKKEKVLVEEWVEKTEAEASSSIKKKKKDKEKDKDKEKSKDKEKDKDKEKSKDKKKSKKHKKDKKHKNKK